MKLTIAAEIVFWLSAAALAYTYVGYPTLIALVSRFWVAARAERLARERRADEPRRARDEEPAHRFFVRQSNPMRGSSNGMRISSGSAGS